MTFEVNESQPLGRFIYDRAWTSLKGAYLYPLRFFATERSNDPNDYLEVVRVFDVSGVDIAVTRGGGLFARDRGQLNSSTGTDQLVSIINLLLCQFALEGLISHPVTDIDIQAGKLIGHHASIVGGGGSYAERTWGPFALLASTPKDLGEMGSQRRNPYWPPNFYWTTYDPGILEKVEGCKAALKLQQVGATLPSLLVAALHHSSRHNASETILTGWIVCEQILSYYWDEHVNCVQDPIRRRRLADTRTYTAAVRAELLHTAQKMEKNTYLLFQKARKARNDLAHRAVTSREAPSDSIAAMRRMLNMLGIDSNRVPGYAYQRSGHGAPSIELEPSFQFN